MNFQTLLGEENITNLYNIQMDESLKTPLDAASEMHLSQVTIHRSNWLPPAASVPVQPTDRSNSIHVPPNASVSVLPSDINTEHMVLPDASVPVQPSDRSNWIHVPPNAPVSVQPSDITEHTVQPNASVTVQQSDITEHRLPMIETAVDEIQSLEDLRLCLEVQFYGEVKYYATFV